MNLAATELAKDAPIFSPKLASEKGTCQEGYTRGVEIAGADGKKRAFGTNEYCGEKTHSCEELGIDGTPQCVLLTGVNVAFHLTMGADACMPYCMKSSVLTSLAEMRSGIATDAHCTYMPSFPFYSTGEMIPFPDCTAGDCEEAKTSAAVPVPYEGPAKEFGNEKFFDYKAFLPKRGSSLLQTAEGKPSITKRDAHGNFGGTYVNNPIALGTSPEAVSAYKELSKPRLNPAELAKVAPKLAADQQAAGHEVKKALEYEKGLDADNRLAMMADYMKNKALPVAQYVTNSLVFDQQSKMHNKDAKNSRKQLQFDYPDAMIAATENAIMKKGKDSVRRRALGESSQEEFRKEMDDLRDHWGLHHMDTDKVTQVADQRMLNGIMAEELANAKSALGQKFAKKDVATSKHSKQNEAVAEAIESDYTQRIKDITA